MWFDYRVLYCISFLNWFYCCIYGFFSILYSYSGNRLYMINICWLMNLIWVSEQSSSLKVLMSFVELILNFQLKHSFSRLMQPVFLKHCEIKCKHCLADIYSRKCVFPHHEKDVLLPVSVCSWQRGQRMTFITQRRAHCRPSSLLTFIWDQL